MKSNRQCVKHIQTSITYPTLCVPAVENPIVFAADLKIPVSLSPSKLSAGLAAPEPSSINNGPVSVSPALFTSPKFASSKLPTSKYVGVVPEVPSSPVVDLINNFLGEVELSATNSHGKT